MSKCCIIKSNTPELRQRLEQSGISVCICSSFKEAYQEDFIKEINPIICEMSLLTCANNLKGNDYAVDFLQTTITVSLLFRNYNFINN